MPRFRAGWLKCYDVDLNKTIYATIEQWRNRPIEGEHP